MFQATVRAGLLLSLGFALTVTSHAWAQPKHDLKLAYFVGDQHAMSKPREPQTRKPPAARSVDRELKALERRLARLQTERKAERQRFNRQVLALRRGAERRLAAMVKEIAALRHHEARAEVLARMVAEREANLAAQERRIAQLETLLRNPTHLG